jgi:hypothetical protein
MGRLYRGIQDSSLDQYVHIGDPAAATDNEIFKDDDKGTAFKHLAETSAHGDFAEPQKMGLPPYGMKGSPDDRWVFTEESPMHEMETAAALAASARVLKGYNDPMAADCLTIARELWKNTSAAPNSPFRICAAIELYRTTGEKTYIDAIPAMADGVAEEPEFLAWLGAYSLQFVKDPAYVAKMRSILADYKKTVDKECGETPYGIPYVPHIWGAGWGIQHMGVSLYYLHEGAPDLFPADGVMNALEFVLGRHPGANNASFVSGVGANSVLNGYGINRADHSYIPGGIVSGTALIRPDYPELNNWPFFWQQTEYCLGAPTSEYVFLVLAADNLLKNEKPEIAARGTDAGKNKD